MSAQHTPGPWMTYPREFEHYEYGVRATPGTICVMPGWKMHADLAEQQKKNLLLIAAAPDLLEVLIEMVADDAVAIADATAMGIPFPPEFLVTYEKARAAIAKATGETP